MQSILLRLVCLQMFDTSTEFGGMSNRYYTKSLKRCSHCARHRTTSDDVVRCRPVSLKLNTLI